MRLDEKYILITGGAGFIGSHTAHALLEKNARVYIIDNLSSGRKENIPPRTTFVNSNLEDNDLSKLFPNIKFDMVYHFAFNVNVPAAVRNPLIEIPSIASSINLFEYCRNTGVKHIVFASSEFIYGNSQNFPLKESEPHSIFCVKVFCRKLFTLLPQGIWNENNYFPVFYCLWTPTDPWSYD